jgi:hypothetical protein
VSRDVDSDLPSAAVGPLVRECRADVAIGGADSVSDRLDVSAALDQVTCPC